MPILDYLQSVAYIADRPFFEHIKIVDSIRLPFNMQAQTQTNWCWAATSTSVSIFYRPASTWTQCRVANDELGLTGCCNAPVPGGCNVPWFLDRALTRTGNYVSISGPITYDDVVSELRAGRVVGARIGWQGGGGHFMVIHGARRVGADRFFDIDDPIFGQSQLTVAAFSNSYQGNGTWTHAYRTRRPLIVFPLQPIPLPEFLIDVLRRYRPLISDPRGLEQEGTAVALAHRVYTLGLRDLTAAVRPDENPSFLRAFTMAGKQIVGFIDVADSDSGEILQVGEADNPYVAGFERALDQAARSEEFGEGPVEPRLLRIPALYTDILWLHGEDGKDRAIIIASPHEVPLNRLMKLDELLKLMSPLSKRLLKESGDDDTIGS